MKEPILVSIQTGLPQTYRSFDAPDAIDKPWTSGIFKQPVEGRVWLGELNLEGDGQADLAHHGGEEKAVNLYPSEHYDFWHEKLNLPDMRFGAFGENFTTAGLIESEVCIGDCFAVGEAVVQVSQPRQPCWKPARRWKIKDLAVQIQDTGFTGWYFRVLQTGFVEAGLPVKLIERPFPEWTISIANEIMHRRKNDLKAAKSLAECTVLSRSWRESLLKRAALGKPADASPRLFGESRSF